MSWQVDVRPVGPLQMNSVLITGQGPDGPETILVDPGAEPAALLRWIDNSKGRLVALLATHGHFDHVGATAEVQRVYDLPLRCHADDLDLIRQMPQIQEAYGFEPSEIPRCETDLADGTVLPFAGGEIRIEHVPGHSPGQLMFVLSGTETPTAIVGDCLFAGSVGRTDLPGGSFETLEKSIRERIYALPGETIVVCGHGPDTTVGREKATNPFVQG